MGKLLLIIMLGGALLDGLAPSDPPLLIDASQPAPAAPSTALDATN